MSATRLSKFDMSPPARLVAHDFARPAVPAPALPGQAVPQPDPHAILFRNACARLAGEAAAIEQQLRGEAVETIERVIGAVAPALLEAGARESLAALLRSFSTTAHPSLEIRAAADTIETLKNSGIGATFNVDDTLAPGDFLASWPHGGMRRDADALINELLAALAGVGDDHA